ncbi:MAG TPA: 2,3-bisphosphoglycerate-independent phosphoglycerate mutase [Acidimicrobiia bacterium]|nr:2,3-bisphosphoglycerate-independent phosphoglycerate mutase [Acidimicrobiia bacterium]
MDVTPLIQAADTKTLLVVMDGLGGYADAEHGTELEDAATPNLDQLAADGTTGLVEPVGPGITPGSGPGHLGLFGYDPERFELGRGALSAAGLDFELRPGDVAARGNLCTLAADGTVADRRAGRLPDHDADAAVAKLQDGVHLDGAEVFFRHEREHRLLVVLRGAGLDPALTDTDPQHEGVAPLDPQPLEPEAKHTAELVTELVAQAQRVLAGEPRANGVLLRGFDTQRALPGFGERYGLRAAAVAIYPMYRGIARLLGMDVLGRPATLADELQILRDAWPDYDYLFLHHKGTDSAGEDGDRPRKIAAIEQLDAVVPELRALAPDVIAVSGDHSTPTQMAAHSWHPVPALLWSDRCGRDDVDRFGERWCRQGGLGLRPTKDLMPVMLANAGRLQKYGA